MRWLAVIGQVTGAVVAQSLCQVMVPWIPVAVVLGVTAVSNIVLTRVRSRVPVGVVLWLDVLLLAVLLFYIGGPHNPFTSLFLLHITLAAMTLRTGALWCMVATTIACYSGLFFWHHPVVLNDMVIASGCASYAWHLHGMFLAFVTTAVFLAGFVSSMHRLIIHQDTVLERARLQAEKTAHFAALATLSAGVAHELGSPLATISLASSELLIALARPGGSPGAAEDALLIQQEAQRCRSILDRLNVRNACEADELVVAASVGSMWAELLDTAPSAVIQRVRLADLTRQRSFLLPRRSIVQAVAILLNNAHQADASGAAIELCFGNREDRLEITVKDRGQEPLPQVLEHAADPFFTTKEPGAGMGLGLFLVKSLAVRLGGDFALSRTPDGGTLALLTLGLAAPGAREVAR